jgi:hypothetical protein
MSELLNELNERFEDVDEHYQKLLKRQETSGGPISERLVKRHRDLKICLDALASINEDLVDVSVFGSVGDGDDPTPPQRELRRQEDRKQ